MYLKKIACILLLGIFLFNWFGYRLLTYLQEREAIAVLEVRLDNNSYNEEDLVSIKVPSALPYSIPSARYERVNGEIEINGVHYNYVKRRLFDDSLEYVCIPNEAKMKVSDARNEFFKLVNDLEQYGKTKPSGKNTVTIKNLLTEFFQAPMAWSFRSFESGRRVTAGFFEAGLPELTLSPQERPPDASRAFFTTLPPGEAALFS